MSFSIILVNRSRTPLSLLVNNAVEVIEAGESVDINDIRRGELIYISDVDALRVHLELPGRAPAPIPLHQTPFGQAFEAVSPGTYVVTRNERQERRENRIDACVREIIERIFRIPPVPPVAAPFGAGVGIGAPFPGFNPYQPCNNTAAVIDSINNLLLSVPVPERCRVLNTIVLAFVPNQGRTEVTMLEAAIITRNVPLVAYLLAAGANPNLTTSGVPFAVQLAPAARFDPRVVQILQLLACPPRGWPAQPQPIPPFFPPFPGPGIRGVQEVPGGPGILLNPEL